MFENKLFDIPIEEYHIGKYQNHISKSDIITTLKKSPAHYKYYKDHPRKQTPAMALGCVIHDAVLQPENLDKYAFEPDYKKNTKIGKSDYENWLNKQINKTIIPKQCFLSINIPASEYIQKMVDAVQSHPTAKFYLQNQNTVFEKSIFWEDKASELLCKCRPDALWLSDDNKKVVIVELKTTDDASKKGFFKTINKYEYYIQAAHYTIGVKTVYDKAEEFLFVFIAVEKAEPFGCAMYNLDNSYWMIGKHDCTKALALLSKCYDDDNFPAYDTNVQTLSPPIWMMTD